MMKCISIFLSLIAACLPALAQSSGSGGSQELSPNAAAVLYESGNYAGVIHLLARESTREVGLGRGVGNTDRAFYLCASKARLGDVEALDDLKEFLHKYPETLLRERAALAIGAAHLLQGDYNRAVYFLESADPNGLNPSEVRELSVRLCYARLRKNPDLLRGAQQAEVAALRGQLETAAREDDIWGQTARYYLAQILVIEGRYATAETVCGTITEKSLRTEVSALRAEAAYAQGEYGKAVEAVDRLRRLNPAYAGNYRTARLAGLSYFALKDYPEAVRNLEMYRAKDKACEAEQGAALALGLAYYRLGRFGDAEAPLWAAAAGKTKDAATANLYLGQSLLKANKYADAVVAFQSVQNNPAAPSRMQEAALYNIAMALDASGSSAFGQSVRVAEDFFARYPQSEYIPEMGKLLSKAYYTSKDFATSLSSVERLGRTTAEIRQAKQYVLFRLGRDAFTAGNSSAADSYLTSAVSLGRLGSYYGEALLQRAQLYYESGMYAKAESDASVFVRLPDAEKSANYKSGVELYAYTLFNQKKFEQAYPLFADLAGGAPGGLFIDAGDKQAAARAKADLAAYLSRMGDCLFARRRFPEAEKRYTEAYQSDPATGATPLYRLAEIYAIQGQYDKQIQTIDKLLSMSGKNPYAAELLYERGRAAILGKRPVNVAVSSLNTVIRDYPDTRWARLSAVELAMFQYRNRDTDAAVNTYKTLIKKYPQSDEAHSALNDLRTVCVENDRSEEYTEFLRSLGAGYADDIASTARPVFLLAESRYREKAENAGSSLRAYLKQYPNGADAGKARLYLAISDEDAGKTDDAYRAYSDLVSSKALEDVRQEALARMAAIEYGRRQYAEAYGHYSAARKLSTNEALQSKYGLNAMEAGLEAQMFAEVIETGRVLLENIPETDKNTDRIHLITGKAFEQTGDSDRAADNYAKAVSNTDGEEGAEALVRLADLKLKTGKIGEAKKLCEAFIKRSSPRQYWLARGFILLSDIYAREGNRSKARQYLVGLKDNYKETSDDIHDLIDRRLEKLQQ